MKSIYKLHYYVYIKITTFIIVRIIVKQYIGSYNENPLFICYSCKKCSRYNIKYFAI